MNCQLVMNTTTSSISNTFITDKNLIIYNSGYAYIYLCNEQNSINITNLCKNYKYNNLSIKSELNWKIKLIFICSLISYIF
jgi:hypothetical protein